MPLPDDITTRLRHAAELAKTEDCIDFDPGFAEAANEIDRLRQQVADLERVKTNEIMDRVFGEIAAEANQQ